MSMDDYPDWFWYSQPMNVKDNNDDLAKTDPKALILDEKELN